MLITFEAARGAAIDATDENAGSLRDLLFDRTVWRIRYLEVAVSQWLPGRRVLLSPVVVEEADWSGESLKVRLTAK